MNIASLMEILKNYILKFKTFGDNLLRAKAFNIAKNPKNDGYQRGLASMVYKSCDKNTSGSNIKTENFSNKELTAELHKPIVKIFIKENYIHLF